jgi:hypothetical protein
MVLGFICLSAAVKLLLHVREMLSGLAWLARRKRCAPFVRKLAGYG